MIHGTLRTTVQEKRGDWARVFQVLSIVASIAAAAWYVEDRRHAEVSRVSSDLETKLERLDARQDARIAELNRAMDAVNRRLDRLLEMQVELSARRND